MRILGIRHITLAVRDIDRARETFARLFGAASGDDVTLPAFGIRKADLALGEGTLQLSSPVDRDNPLRRFLDRRGEAFYALALDVDDLDGAIAELRSQGVRVSEPVEMEPGVRSAFVAMAATHGLSIQLVAAAPAAPGKTALGGTTLPPEEGAVANDERPPLDLTPDEWSDVD